jgi:hypothetical protein
MAEPVFRLSDWPEISGERPTQIWGVLRFEQPQGQRRFCASLLNTLTRVQKYPRVMVISGVQGDKKMAYPVD